MLDPHAMTGLAIVVSPGGSLIVRLGFATQIRELDTGLSLKYKKWAKINLVVSKSTLQLRVTPLIEAFSPAGASGLYEWTMPERIAFSPQVSLFLAASNQSPTSGEVWAGEHFNGRLDTVNIEALGQSARLLANYDFSIDMSSDFIRDTSGNGLDGVLVNAPSRAVKGYNWDGSEPDWTKARYGYGAIHFHEDDLDDARWETDFTITLPKDARSGVYGVELQSESSDVNDTVVFFVRPSGVTSTQVSHRTTTLYAIAEVGNSQLSLTAIFTRGSRHVYLHIPRLRQRASIRPRHTRPCRDPRWLRLS